MRLDITDDPISLTTALVNVPSESGHEDVLADAVHEALLRQAPHLQVTRSGNTVLARTNLGRPTRVVLAGHLDTVPVNDNLPLRRTGSGADLVLHGCGTVDMKGGDAVMLHLAAAVASSEPAHDLTFILYDCEEIEAARNGLGRVERELPDWLRGDLAIVGEPSSAVIEAGCQGTMRAEVRTTGHRAHTARAWMGSNAIHAMGEVLRRLAEFQPRTVDIDGCRYREGLQAVRIRGGVAGNVIPDRCVVTVNYRFAPSKSVEQAFRLVCELFTGYDVVQTDGAPGARPGLDQPAAKAFLDVVGEPARPKYGWTDVSRFSELGIPAVNFGPGDPNLAHKDDERCPADQIRRPRSAIRLPSWVSDIMKRLFRNARRAPKRARPPPASVRWPPPRPVADARRRSP